MPSVILAHRQRHLVLRLSSGTELLAHHGNVLVEIVIHVKGCVVALTLIIVFSQIGRRIEALNP
jgi:hypothetical protein